jgi:hypothetical protein
MKQQCTYPLCGAPVNIGDTLCTYHKQIDAIKRQQAATQRYQSSKPNFPLYGKGFASQIGSQGGQPVMTSSNSQNVRIWWDQAVNAYRMTVPYNPSFNETFKTLIPHSDRAWSPDSKTWTITENYFNATKSLVEKIFGNATVITRSAQEKASQPPPVKTAPIDQVLLQFVRLLPYDAARRAYLLAANALHPDKGGDMTKMADLNACWQRLEKEWFNKSQ